MEEARASTNTCTLELCTWAVVLHPLNFSTFEVCAVFLLGICVCGQSGNHPQEDIEKVTIITR
jgi:hypothetical protein